ncbi:hypothetical protein GMSM_40340 [Geomonas sp. Red276]
MREAPSDNAGAQAPALFSFITLREEAFGGILFNPYTAVECELGPVETRLMALCTGEYTVSDILSRCRQEFDLGSEAIAAKWQETLAMMTRAHAVRFVAQKGASPAPASRPGAIGTALPFSTPKSVIWDVTYACNLSCPHCLTSSGRPGKSELGTVEAFRLVDKLAAAKVLYLSLAGGEPFARRDIWELLRHIAKTGMRVDIATNGYRVPPAIIEGLADLPVFQIQVSIDGIGEDHDRFRGKRGAFADACAALRRFKETGLSTSISTTATAGNIDSIGQIIDLAVELGCDGYKAIPFIPAGRGKTHGAKLRLDREGSIRLTETLARKQAELQGKISISMKSTFLFLLDKDLVPAPAEGKMICSAGYDELSVGADGTAYPCPFLHDFPLGSLVNDSVEEIWRESRLLNEMRNLEKAEMTGPCRTCGYASEHCRGGCRASAFMATGSLKGSDPLCFKS